MSVCARAHATAAITKCNTQCVKCVNSLHKITKQKKKRLKMILIQTKKKTNFKIKCTIKFNLYKYSV